MVCSLRGFWPAGPDGQERCPLCTEVLFLLRDLRDGEAGAGPERVRVRARALQLVQAARAELLE